MRRVGYGIRVPEFAALLGRLDPVDVHDEVWAGTELRISAYLAAEADVPDLLVTSVRCVVHADDQLVVCRDPGSLHALPGGHRENGESVQQTVVREVYEETGWHLNPETLLPLGFLHLELRSEPARDHAYPYPDAVHLVFSGSASERAVTRQEEWTDIDGWELETFLVAENNVLDLGLNWSSVPFVKADLARR